MSQLPLFLKLFNEVDDSFINNESNSLGISLHPKDIILMNKMPKLCLPKVSSRWRYSPYYMKRPMNKTKTIINKEDDVFQVSINVKNFKPDEISVKTVDNFLVIEAKHEEREDIDGTIMRHFVRRCEIPKEFDPMDIISSLSSDGILTIKTKSAKKPAKKKERIVKIQLIDDQSQSAIEENGK